MSQVYSVQNMSTVIFKFANDYFRLQNDNYSILFINSTLSIAYFTDLY